jgi:hypothetical protein
MFDWYEPVPDIKCPKCQEILKGWQGKSGPCELAKFKQYEAAQVLDVLHDEYGHPEHPQTLPRTFRIYTECCNHHWTEAEGTASCGVWIKTEVTDTRPTYGSTNKAS